MYSGLHPAITAFAAIFSAVTATLRDGIEVTTVSGLSWAAASISLASARDGGTTGRPSVHPRAMQNSICSAASTGTHTSPSAAGTSSVCVFGCAISFDPRNAISRRLSLLQQRDHLAGELVGAPLDVR